ncbi:TIGR03986 family type III CRISPR-associated RAMP protein [Vibrio sp. PNB23_22_6]|uniref:TIGR03986 family type III CRISPR-associated RAMP protein n=1 Tax=unclassified Vibrio TaxID=2614977 RepID=UPI000BFFEE64|nr:TIGR03986 family CRISPR-associated RAMP protein [Vibrio sp. PID17_43]PHJ42195.1 hypothetical protein AK965_06720 [Vibrio sp. PID17_43]
MNAKVHTPYHFVPLSKWVYMPDWAHLVSHDVPFKDGLSGVLEYTLTNHTPLCVGAEQDRKKGASTLVEMARDPLHYPIIPGSTMKGAIRSVVEISSFGKFSNVDDQIFSFRDFKNEKYKSIATRKLSNNWYESLAKSAWLKFNPEKSQWELKVCKHTIIFNKDLNNAFPNNIEIINQPTDKDKGMEGQTATHKYKAYPLNQPRSQLSFDEYCIEIEGTKGKPVTVECAHRIGSGQETGNLVFTDYRFGSKTYRDTRLNFSYLFFAPGTKTDVVNQNLVDSLFANHNEDLVLTLRKKPHPEYGIPVFVLFDRGQVHSLGFAKMPRMTYKNSIHDIIYNTSNAHFENAYFDMAELMFGTLRDGGIGLKSRVSFSDATIDKDAFDENTSVQRLKPTVLNSPKATFLGAYLEQPLPRKYSTYDNDQAQLKGWKRYPVKSQYQHHEPESKNLDVCSSLETLRPGHSFSGKVVFHNLHPIELGALLWGISLGDYKNARHTIGHGKPLGAGAVSIEIDESRSLVFTHQDRTSKVDLQRLKTQFVEHMNSHFKSPKGWQESPQIRYLVALTDKNVDRGNTFNYMKLSEFSDVKEKKQSIPDISFDGVLLPRKEEETPIRSSLAFNSGRLKVLFDNENKYHCLQEELKQALLNRDLPYVERTTQILKAKLVNQHQLTNSAKDKLKRDILAVVKELKQQEITLGQVQELIVIFKRFEVAKEACKKAIKYLEKL